MVNFLPFNKMGTVDPGFDIDLMAKTLICEGPIVTWDRFWSSAFAKSNPYWSLNRSLFSSMITEAVKEAGIPCSTLLKIVHRLKLFLEQKRVAQTEVVGGLLDVFKGILEETSPRHPCIVGTWEYTDMALRDDLIERLKDLDCTISGSLQTRWKKANATLSSMLRVGSPEAHALKFVPTEKTASDKIEWTALRLRAMDELWSSHDVVLHTAYDVVDGMYADGGARAGEKAKAEFKKRLGIHDKRDRRWGGLMKVLWLKATTDESMFGESTVIPLLRELEGQTGLSIKTLVQNDPVLNPLSLHTGERGRPDENIWESDDEDEGDDLDKLDPTTWNLLNHFHHRWEVCAGESDPANCLVAGLPILSTDASDRVLVAAQTFVDVKRDVLPRDAPLQYYNFERELIRGDASGEMNLERWNREFGDNQRR